MSNYLSVRDALMSRDCQVARPNPIVDQSAWRPGKKEVVIQVGESRSQVLLVLVDITDETELPHVIVQTQVEDRNQSCHLTFGEFLEALKRGAESISHTDSLQSSEAPSVQTPPVL